MFGTESIHRPVWHLELGVVVESSCLPLETAVDVVDCEVTREHQARIVVGVRVQLVVVLDVFKQVDVLLHPTLIKVALGEVVVKVVTREVQGTPARVETRDCLSAPTNEVGKRLIFLESP